MAITLSNPNQPNFNFFFTGKFTSKFEVKWLLKTPPHLAYVAAHIILWNTDVRKQALNDKLQGSVVFKVWWGCH